MTSYQLNNSENSSRKHSLEACSSLNSHELSSASKKNKDNEISSAIAKSSSRASSQNSLFQRSQLPALEEDTGAASEASSYLNGKVENSSSLNNSGNQTELFGKTVTASESGLKLNFHTKNLIDLTKKLVITAHNLDKNIPKNNSLIKEEIIPIVVEVRKSIDKIYSIMSVLPSNSETIQIIFETSNALANFEFDLQALIDTNTLIVSSVESTVMQGFAEELGSKMQTNTNEEPLNNLLNVIKQLGETCSRFSETLWQTS